MFAGWMSGQGPAHTTGKTTSCSICVFNLESSKIKREKPSTLSFHVIKTLIEGPPSEYSLKLGFTKSLTSSPSSPPCSPSSSRFEWTSTLSSQSSRMPASTPTVWFRHPSRRWCFPAGSRSSPPGSAVGSAEQPQGLCHCQMGCAWSSPNSSASLSDLAWHKPSSA